MWTRWHLLPLVAVAGLVGCATIPTGPSVVVLPGQGKPFEQFQADDAICRQWASAQVGTTPGDASAEAAWSSAALWTILGAGLGAIIGSSEGHVGTGAAIGAAGGAIAGAAAGVGAAQAAGGTVQSRYDTAYQQCMYTKGNQIPVTGTPQTRYGAPPPPPPPGPYSAPPAPPPPPPAGASSAPPPPR